MGVVRVGCWDMGVVVVVVVGWDMVTEEARYDLDSRSNTNKSTSIS